MLWHGSPNGSVAAQCAFAGLAGLPALAGAPLDAAFLAGLRAAAFAGFALAAFPLAGLAFLAAFLLVRAGLIRGPLCPHPMPALRPEGLGAPVPGRWFEEFTAGDVIEHAPRVPVRQEDNVAFCRLTHNNQPLHLDAAAARKAGFADVLVNGLYTFSTAVGVSVEDTTAGTLVANLGYSQIEHPKPVHPGDTLAFRTQVVDKRPSSKPGRGIVTLEHLVRNQADEVVCRFQRTVMVRSKAGAA